MLRRAACRLIVDSRRRCRHRRRLDDGFRDSALSSVVAVYGVTCASSIFQSKRKLIQRQSRLEKTEDHARCCIFVESTRFFGKMANFIVACRKRGLGGHSPRLPALLTILSRPHSCCYSLDGAWKIFRMRRLSFSLALFISSHYNNSAL